MDKNINKQPLVSVIMPVYNGEMYLSEAIESVLNQTYSNLELLIVDDGSTDGSTIIINRYLSKDKRVKALFNKRNKGISYTLNKAILNSKGKYIARLDCDDVCCPKRIYEEIKVMERKPKVGVCGTGAYAIDTEGTVKYKMKPLNGILLNYNYWKPSPFISSSVMIRKKLLSNELFDSTLDTVEDYDMWLRLKKKCQYYNLEKRLVLYRINPKGVSLTGADTQKQLSKKAFLKNINLHSLKTVDYLALVCLNFDIDFNKRRHLLHTLSKQISYPLWIQIIDNLYYEFRKILFSLNPKLNHHR